MPGVQKEVKEKSSRVQRFRVQRFRGSEVQNPEW
jgi:hypothetical protein